MKPSPHPSRKPSELSDSVHQQLNMYVVAASAAGVGLLALASPAEGKIVYTSAHTKIVLCDTTCRYGLDLSHDGYTDFTLSINRISTSSAGTSLGIQGGASGNQAVGFRVGADGESASALQYGRWIGPDLRFGRYNGMARRVFATERVWCSGPWANVTKRYLGLRFEISGRLHYGWARLNVSCRKPAGWGGLTGLLTGYAYETIPNKPIIAGKMKGTDVITREPGSLGSLAAGASRFTAESN